MPAASSVKKARQCANKVVQKKEDELESLQINSEPIPTDIPLYSEAINSFDEAIILLANSVTSNVTLHHIWQAAVEVG